MRRAAIRAARLGRARFSSSSRPAQDYDVVVVGGGVMGASVAYHTRPPPAHPANPHAPTHTFTHPLTTSHPFTTSSHPSPSPIRCVSRLPHSTVAYHTSRAATDALYHTSRLPQCVCRLPHQSPTTLYHARCVCRLPHGTGRPVAARVRGRAWPKCSSAVTELWRALRMHRRRHRSRRPGALWLDHARRGARPARLLCLLRARLAAPARHSPGRGRPTERPATAAGARASRLQSRRCHRLRPLRWSSGTRATRTRARCSRRAASDSSSRCPSTSRYSSGATGTLLGHP